MCLARVRRGDTPSPREPRSYSSGYHPVLRAQSLASLRPRAEGEGDTPGAYTATPLFVFYPAYTRHTARVTRAPHVVIARTHTQSHTLCTRADGEIDVEVLDFELRASITGHTRAHCTLSDSVRERESRTHHICQR